MEIKDVRNNIENFLSNEYLHVNFLNKENIALLKNVYKQIIENVNSMENSVGLDSSKVLELKDDICLICGRIQSSLMVNPIDPNITPFIESFCLLIFNWNGNTIHDESVNMFTSFLPNLIKNHLSILETINILKHLIGHLNKVSNWMPPAIDISKHYFNTIKEKEI